MEEKEYIPNLEPIYKRVGRILHRINTNSDEEDFIDLETNIGFILDVFPDSHYTCKLQKDTIDKYESITFFYYASAEEDEDKINIIKTIYTELI